MLKKITIAQTPFLKYILNKTLKMVYLPQHYYLIY
ncbi:hypothetical protein SAMN05216297_106254 [Flavobacterium phragmitis]|uniref:Uncharacterized protein n=1 Tax=Flavobacterium phragmitis TaxID=739143 RepID=A0A1I1R552_9FLAO|nr:hypothetical protein SAMN05216297_106254 [Flavobacterium phragmitis]